MGKYNDNVFTPAPERALLSTRVRMTAHKESRNDFGQGYVII